jgi:hypothetical protein
MSFRTPGRDETGALEKSMLKLNFLPPGGYAEPYDWQNAVRGRLGELMQRDEEESSDEEEQRDEEVRDDPKLAKLKAQLARYHSEMDDHARQMREHESSGNRDHVVGMRQRMADLTLRKIPAVTDGIRRLEGGTPQEEAFSRRDSSRGLTRGELEALNSNLNDTLDVQTHGFAAHMPQRLRAALERARNETGHRLSAVEKALRRQSGGSR